MSIVFTSAAIGDLDVIESVLSVAGNHVVRSFQYRLARSLERYERFPLLAPVYEPSDPRHPGLRFFPVRRFESYAVFYQPLADGIRVVRVLHTSRNLTAISRPQ